jgi:hypothetical protein
MDDNKNHEPVSFQVYEGTMARMDRSNKRLLIALIAVVTAMLINNVAWIMYENHRQDIQTEQVTYETEENTK